MLKKKVTFIFSNVIDSPIYRALIDEFSDQNYKLLCIFLGEESQPLFEYTKKKGVTSRQHKRVSKSNSILRLILVARNFLIEKPKVVVTFGQTASLIGLLATFFTTRATRMYLRMHTSMNHVERYSRGIVYDKICNRLADIIIVPNRNTLFYVEENENVRRNKIQVIEFGFNLEDFKEPSISSIEAFRNELELTPDQFIIGIVSRYSLVKGLHYSLPAVSKFLSRHPEGILVLVGIGEYQPQELQDLLKEIDPNQLRLIPRAQDMPALYKSLSVFIHTPIDETVESFGLVYVEALAAGTPSIVTLSGIAKEICNDGENCLVVDYCNIQEIENSLESLFKDSDKRFKLAQNSCLSVAHLTMTKMIGKYHTLIDSQF